MIRELIKSMRPVHWSKNLLVFAGLLFAGKATDPELLLHSITAFVSFCLVSSFVYIFNDLKDAAQDRLHPLKKDRPIASGRIGGIGVRLFGAALGCVGLGLACLLPDGSRIVIFGYLLLNILYSVWLKQVVILDVMTIAAGFVLRVLAGTLAIGVETSHWLLICTFLLSLFMGFGKRRSELMLLEESATGHRGVLAHYSQYFLDQMIAVVAPGTLVCYVLYTVSPETVIKVGGTGLLVTVPLVIYGIFRYLYLIHERKQGGDPAVLLVRDPWLLASVAGWVVAVWLVIY
ncbi:MAG: decaprenyl-phosphate phosphoribosyltransferase [Candidatus Glassbacteria bacterium]|nr:decaprenyl-phosphate phosphoribosyltransferase [Candidatus Glassbacteria bacterium]